MHVKVVFFICMRSSITFANFNSVHSMSFSQEKNLDLSKVSKEISDFWELHKVFDLSVSGKSESNLFVFYEGPPSANGLPGIHHVMARTIKDVVCRYKTMRGFRVERKAGWDTHGLPVELGVEKELGITKEDIGKKISIAEYNSACKKAVMRYTDIWNNLTRRMGYWVDMEHPYMTYHTKYIESVWYVISQLNKKGLLYKGFTIQPYSPKAGTGLSSHELNQPGTYRDVKDTSLTAQFEVIKNADSSFLYEFSDDAIVYLLAWTTTPWTLPSNTALTVGQEIEYSLIDTTNRYSGKKIHVVIASARIHSYFKMEDIELSHSILPFDLKSGDGRVLKRFDGEKLVGLKYKQLLPFTLPMFDAEKAFRVIAGDFVTTEDGTGIVHTAPTFGADDMRVAKLAGVPPMLVPDEDGNPVPLVDFQGRFTHHMGEFAGKYVKNEYYEDSEVPAESVDVEIAMKLKREGLAFKIEKYTHPYPHCWRTDKPIIYYPLNSWFVKTTAVKHKLIELNKKINWKPAATGAGRFGNWLENLQDWNLSRSRFWGIPLPIWTSEDKSEQLIIASVAELKQHVEKAVIAGVMSENLLSGFVLENMTDENYEGIDLHKHEVDKLVLVSESGKKLYREPDLIDVWFDSGSMPYAQWHYPFENSERFKNNFPADFIAEGVDQTRGWFFTLHAIAAMTFDDVAFRNVISNGLVLDKNGQKMSKRLGNAVDPFLMLEKYGPDAVRWYMITNAQPWDNLKFDEDGIVEVQRKFFRALHNTYSFFALYANVDGYIPVGNPVVNQDLPELDRWILSKLETLKTQVYYSYDNYDITTAGRLVQDFVVDDLSNWWVRLCRKRFWRGELNEDKRIAYGVLHSCLVQVSQLMAPISPFYAEKLYRILRMAGKMDISSVHLSEMPEIKHESIDITLEDRMNLAQRTCTLIFGIRKKENIRVRQPLNRVIIPAVNQQFREAISSVADIICGETNVKRVEFVTEEDQRIHRSTKANFKVLGPKLGADMKIVAQQIQSLNQQQISILSTGGSIELNLKGKVYSILPEDVQISFDEIPGWTIASEGFITVALDLNITETLLQEGIAREMVNRIQNLRKDSGLDVTDKVNLHINCGQQVADAIKNYLEYIRAETLTETLVVVTENGNNKGVALDFTEYGKILVELEKSQTWKIK